MISLTIVKWMIKHFFFILNFILATCFASDVIRFQNPNAEEALSINQHMLDFYADELMAAGLFSDKKAAMVAAKNEDEFQAGTLTIYIITSENLETKYGYIIYKMEEKSVYLDALFIEEKFRAKGIGKKALNLFEKEILEKGLDEIELFVFAHNSIAFTLYEKMGYIALSSYNNEKGQPIGTLMKKNLKASQK